MAEARRNPRLRGMDGPRDRLARAWQLGRDWARSRIGAARSGGLPADAMDGIRTFCLFVGYPRSGHSLVAAMLDAHPHAVVGREQQVLRHLRAGFGRAQLFWLLADNARRHAAPAARTGGYAYAIDGQWQGRHRELRAIGDKSAWGTTLALERRPDLLERLRDRTGCELSLIHVVRNPFDVIARLAEREQIPLDRAAAHFERLCEINGGLRARVDAEHWRDVRHERFLAAPREELAALCGFLGLDADAAYLEACAKIAFASPRRARVDADWTPASVARVDALIARHPFLAGYSYAGE